MLLRGGGEAQPRFFFTCSRCFGVATRPRRLQQWATPVSRTPSGTRGESSWQQKLTSSFSRLTRRSRGHLSTIWKLTAAERAYMTSKLRFATKHGPGQDWVKDLTEDGDVEPNPGPSSSFQLEFRGPSDQAAAPGDQLSGNTDPGLGSGSCHQTAATARLQYLLVPGRYSRTSPRP